MSDLIALYPNIGGLFNRTLKDAKIGVIKLREFRRIKEQLIVLQFVLDNCDPLQYSQEYVMSLFLSAQPDKRGRVSKANEILDSTIIDNSKAPESSKSWWSLTSIFGSTDKTPSPVQQMVQQALEVERKTSDAEFLSQGERLKSLGDSVQAAVSEAVKMAQSHFNDIVVKTLKKLLDGARCIQKDECMRHIGLEASIQEHKDSVKNRNDLLRAIEQQSLSASQQYEHSHIQR